MIAAFSISPHGGDDTGGSVSEAVAAAVRIVRESGLPNETNSMFTNIEGDWDEVMAVIKRCRDHLRETAPRVSIVIKVDDRDGVSDGLTSKLDAVERHLET